jgi:hypothetical protein
MTPEDLHAGPKTSMLFIKQKHTNLAYVVLCEYHPHCDVIQVLITVRPILL